MEGALGRLRKCFQPRQWFAHEGEPDPSVINEEDRFMWVYRKGTDGSYEVGYFAPDGTWFVDSSFPEVEAARARVNHLNGGR